MWFDSSVRERERERESGKQLILTVLGFTLSWVDVELRSESLWSLGGSLVLWRQKDRQFAQRERERLRGTRGNIYPSGTEIVGGENPVIRNAHTWMKLPYSVFSISPHSLSLSLSLSLSFSLSLSPPLLFWFHSDSLPNLAVEERCYRESCYACVHGWQRCEMTVTKEDAH